MRAMWFLDMVELPGCTDVLLETVQCRFLSVGRMLGKRRYRLYHVSPKFFCQFRRQCWKIKLQVQCRLLQFQWRVLSVRSMSTGRMQWTTLRVRHVRLGHQPCPKVVRHFQTARVMLATVNWVQNVRLAPVDSSRASARTRCV